MKWLLIELLPENAIESELEDCHDELRTEIQWRAV
jgi:hypothetical protein